MGSLPEMKFGDFILSGKYLEASPFAQVTKDDAPTLIYYSDNDPLITTRQAKTMYEKWIQNKVAAKIFPSNNTEHHPLPDMKEVCKWFEEQLN